VLARTAKIMHDVNWSADLGGLPLEALERFRLGRILHCRYAAKFFWRIPLRYVFVMSRITSLY
jgi:hypothetical protein